MFHYKSKLINSDYYFSIFNKTNTDIFHKYLFEYQLYKEKLLTIEYVTLT